MGPIIGGGGGDKRDGARQWKGEKKSLLAGSSVRVWFLGFINRARLESPETRQRNSWKKSLFSWKKKFSGSCSPLPHFLFEVKTEGVLFQNAKRMEEEEEVFLRVGPPPPSLFMTRRLSVPPSVPLSPLPPPFSLLEVFKRIPSQKGGGSHGTPPPDAVPGAEKKGGFTKYTLRRKVKSKSYQHAFANLNVAPATKSKTKSLLCKRFFPPPPAPINRECASQGWAGQTAHWYRCEVHQNPFPERKCKKRERDAWAGRKGWQSYGRRFRYWRLACQALNAQDEKKNQISPGRTSLVISMHV